MSALERRAIRDQLAQLRDELESAMVDITITPSVDVVALTVSLQRSIMELLQYFTSIGGKVLVAPLYYTDHNPAEHPTRTRIRKHKIQQLINFHRTFPHNEIPAGLANQSLLPHQGMEVRVHAVKDRAGVTRVLKRLNDHPEEEGEDQRVWKWVFVDLRETEDVDTIVEARSRWGWVGKFAVGPELEREEDGNPVVVRRDPEDPEWLFELL